MAKSTSKTNTSGRTTQASNSYTKNKQAQKNTQKTNQKTTNNQISDTSGGTNTVSYKDLSHLSPQTLALQNKVYNQTDYTPSQAVQNTYGQKTNAENAVSNYGPYNSKYQASIDETLQNILNRPSFNYDFNADALYQAYADQYAKNGRDAAQNAAAAASALTGGYGNSYAASAANQANEQYMSELNDRIPELYQLALERYNTEGNNLLNQYNVLGSQEDRNYGQYSTERQNLVTDRDYYGSNYNNERVNDQQTWQNAYDNAMALLGYNTNLEARDVTNSENWSHTENNDTTKIKGKETTTNKNTQTSKSKDSSVQNTSSNSTTTGTSSGTKSSSKSSKGKDNKTSSSDYNQIKNQFKKMVDDSRDKNGNTNQAEYHNAWYYLQDQVDAGYITESDMQKMATTLNEWNKRPTK